MKLFYKKEEYNALYMQLMEVQREKAELEREVHKLRNQNMEEFLEEFRYAIFVDDSYKTHLWNEGRREEHVREINFHSSVREFPSIEIEK